ncbi:MAG: hypothetical protein ACJ788_09770 [Ktedonobacteraceae bacterium]
MTKKQLLIIMGTLLIILAGTSMYAMATVNPSAARTSLTNLTPTLTGTATPIKTHRLRSVVGLIRSLGYQKLTINQVHNNAIITVKVNDKTKYKSSHGTITSSDLVVGQQVEITWYLASAQNPLTVIALSVVVLQA